MATSQIAGMSDAQWDALVNGARAGKAQYDATGSFNNQTPSQNLAAVVNQPGNTVANNPSAYITSVLNQAKTDSAVQQNTGGNGGNGGSVVNMGGQGGGQSNSMSQGQSATDLINQIYQSQLAAQQQANKQNRDNLLAGIAGQDDLARQSATSQLNANDVSGARNASALREHMAALGLGQGGDYISQQVGQDTAQGQNANSINQNLTNSLNGNLAQRNAINNNANASDLAIMQNLQGQQSSNLLNDLYKSRDFGLQQANVTGQYNGQNTMQQNQNNFSNGISQGTLTGYYNGPQSSGQQTQSNQGNNQQNGQNPDLLRQLMAANSAAYANASPAQQAQLHQQNLGYASQLGGTYNPQQGTYSYGKNQNTGINGGGSGNVFQSGMGVSAQNNQGIRTLAGQTLDHNISQDNINNAMTLGRDFGLAVDPKSSGQALFNQVKGRKTVPQQQLDSQNDPTTLDGQLKKAQIDRYTSLADKYDSQIGGSGVSNAQSIKAENNAYASNVLSEMAKLDDSDHEGFLIANQADIVKNLGTAGYESLKKSALSDQTAQGKADTAQGKADDAKDKAIKAEKDRVIAAAQRDPDWKYATPAERADLIKQYEGYHQ